MEAVKLNLALYNYESLFNKYNQKKNDLNNTLLYLYFNNEISEMK